MPEELRPAAPATARSAATDDDELKRLGLVWLKKGARREYSYHFVLHELEAYSPLVRAGSVSPSSTPSSQTLPA